MGCEESAHGLIKISFSTLTTVVFVLAVLAVLVVVALPPLRDALAALAALELLGRALLLPCHKQKMREKTLKNLD